MKTITIIGLLTASIFISGCATKSANHVTNKKWLSASEMQSQLERIAEDYAKQHKIDFDFNSAHFGIYAVTFRAADPSTLSPQPLHKGIPVFGTVIFEHGLKENILEMLIDTDGNVIDALIVKPEGG